MMRSAVSGWLGIVVIWGGCNAALDFDALQKSPSTDEEGDKKSDCDVNSDCDDRIDCTFDKCNSEGRCVNDPNNAACPGFEVCRRQEGCVDVGRECILDSDCDDGIDCTKDFCRNDGTCRNTADDSRCFDPDNRCIGAMICDPEAGCKDGFERQCPQDDESCYNLFCNPVSGECDIFVPKPGADDDEDGYCDMNVDYDGDDCLDTDATIHPGATEVCDLRDNDCDGLTDGTVVEMGDVLTAETILAPAVAFGDGRYVVAWQEGSGDGAEVKLKVLGEGACLAATECDEGSVSAAFETVDLTDKAGADARGESPRIAFVDGRFHVVWVATADTGTPKVVRTSFSVSSDTAPSFDEVDILSDDALNEIHAVDLGVSDGALVIAWGAALADGTEGLQLLRDGGAIATLAVETAAVDAVSIDCQTGNTCMVAYDRESAGDPEVHIGRVDIAGTPAFGDGWPKAVSDAAVGPGDPSRDPAVVWLADDWAVAYSDIKATQDGFEETSGIRGTFGDAIMDLLTDAAGQHQMKDLVYDGHGLDLLFVNDVQGALTLQVALFDGAFGRVAQQRLAIAVQDDGSLVPSQLIWTGSDLALAWASKPAGGDARLHFLAFETCRPAK